MVRFNLDPGSALEVSIDGDIYGPWFTATILSRVSSNEFLVEYNDLDLEPVIVGFH